MLSPQDVAPSTAAAQTSSEGSARVAQVQRWRAQFPALRQEVHGKPLVYLDSAATAQKPQAMLDALSAAYVSQCANIHRAVHLLGARATTAYEGVRDQVRDFIGADSREEIVFVRGTTEAINLVAHSYGALRVAAGDEIIISALEHHSNIVPWQLLCARHGAQLKVVPINQAGEVDVAAYRAMLGPRTRVVALSQVSNALGTVVPVAEMARLAHRHDAVVLVDGAQAVPHMPVDVQALGADFYCFSGHKLFGPTGVGVLWGRKALLDAMPPYQGGGDMIATVRFDETTYNEVPHKFEAGTPDIAGVIALGATLEFLASIGMATIAEYEQELLAYGTRLLEDIDGLRLVGTARHKASVLSFVLDDIHPHDVGTVLDSFGIAIRTGHHCAQPVMEFYDLPATARASLAFYNTTAELDALAAGIRRVQKMFGRHG